MEETMSVRDAIKRVVDTLDTVEVKGPANMRAILTCRDLCLGCLEAFKEPPATEIVAEEVPANDGN